MASTIRQILFILITSSSAGFMALSRPRGDPGSGARAGRSGGDSTRGRGGRGAGRGARGGSGAPGRGRGERAAAARGAGARGASARPVLGRRRRCEGTRCRRPPSCGAAPRRLRGYFIAPRVYIFRAGFYQGRRGRGAKAGPGRGQRSVAPRPARTWSRPAAPGSPGRAALPLGPKALGAWRTRRPRTAWPGPPPRRWESGEAGRGLRGTPDGFTPRCPLATIRPGGFGFLPSLRGRRSQGRGPPRAGRARPSLPGPGGRGGDTGLTPPPARGPQAATRTPPGARSPRGAPRRRRGRAEGGWPGPAGSRETRGSPGLAISNVGFRALRLLDNP